MTDRQWSAYTSQIQTASYSDGQTEYDVGVGFWLGLDAGVPKFSLGNSAGNKVTWNGTTLSITGALSATSLELTGAAQTFTPTWNGFSVNPTQTPSYIDLGTHAIIYWSSGSDGTLSGTSWSVSNIPAAIRPSINANIIGIASMDGDWTQVRVGVSTAGVASLAIAEVSGSNIVYDPSGWGVATTAAPGAGSVWFYPL